MVERKSTAFATDEPAIAFYISAELLDKNCARKLARLIRGHWAGCESRNHWIRDAIFEEDKTRSKNFNLNANLAILRAGLIALKSFVDPDTPWQTLKEQCQHKPAHAYQMVVNHSSK